MRHLKNFNESHSDYYELCSSDLFLYNYNNKKMILMSDRDKSKISEILSNMDYGITEIGNKTTFIISFPYEDIVMKYWINKTDDDYFFLQIEDPNRSNIYYKCDQIDGLKKCLEDIL